MLWDSLLAYLLVKWSETEYGKGGYVPVLILVLFIDAAHESGSGRKHLVDKDEDGLLGRELDALTDNINELADGEVGRHQVLLFVDRSDIALLDLLANDL